MSEPMRGVRINSDRLWQSIMEMARIGATAFGGVERLALTDLDKEARDLFIRWASEAGCTVTVDAMGNIFAHRAGLDDRRPPVMTGSHLDTQPKGGKFDGAYGVMAGLEVVRTLNDVGYQTAAPIEIAVWTNEEGSRFAPCLIGSGVFAGVVALDEGLACSDGDGKTIGEELERIGYTGSREPSGHPVAAYIAAHIEQGPMLEAEAITIGVVSGVLGIRWYEVVITGQASHAGPTPMLLRRDALVGAARLVQEVHSIGLAYLPDACATAGEIHASPNSRNVIPGQVALTVDLRHSDARQLGRMEGDLRHAVTSIARDMKLHIALSNVMSLPSASFARECIDVIREEADGLGLTHRDIISGAGQDAAHLALVAPAAMIFIPCEGGISHNEMENASPFDAAAGCDVLLRTLVRLADRKASRRKRPHPF